MAQTCTKCSRANPGEAVYCYYDGMVLNGHGKAGGPVAVSSQAFNSPFVFPSGKTCRNFNELALACQENWVAAKDLLQQGFLGSFLGGAGRVDLAMAAKQAAAFPDHDRGLDELLGKLPADVLQAPKLGLETQEINLGHTPFGTGRKIELKMENLGGRLLYGTVTCRDGWISFGDQPGVSSKTFQFTHDLTLPVKIVGDRLRASNKPIETQIVIESSGGTKTIVVRAEVPVKVFPPGILGGAKSPRQVAEKAKPKAKEAAPLFERGEVRTWYKDNGWTYPVQGRDASGLGAVQQFFEALGLTPAPKVDVSQRSISLTGNAGQQLQHILEVKTEEKRPVYASGNCDETWVEVGKARLNGRVASIPITVTVPNSPGQKLTTKLTVLSNGNQKFNIPVTLQVGGSAIPGAPIPVQAMPVQAISAQAVPVRAVPVQAMPAFSPAIMAAETVAATPRSIQPAPDDDFGAMATSPTASVALARPGSRRGGRDNGNPANGFMHAIPAGLLLIAVVVVVCIDLLGKKADASSGKQTSEKTKKESNPDKGDYETDRKPDPDKPKKDPKGWDYGKLKDTQPLLGLQFAQETRRFGLVMLREKDPTTQDKLKKLTYWETGDSNNTIIKIGGNEYYFGRKTLQNRWQDNYSFKDLPNGRKGAVSTMDFTLEKVIVTQHVEIVPGESRLLDTCLVFYTIRNYGAIPQKVGIRVLLDTYIGANDGVPFTIPGQRGFLTTMKEFPQKEIPDYIEAVEKPEDVNDLGTVVRMGLKGIRLPGVDSIEDIESMRICRWPQNKDTKWVWEMEPMDFVPTIKDSCVALYWAYRDMDPAETRQMAFTYGLSKLDIGLTPEEKPPAPGETAMAMSVPTQISTNSEFVVTAYLWRTKAGQKATLNLPEGLTLAGSESAEKAIEDPGDKRVQVSWKVKSGAKGTYKIQATSDKAKTKPREIEVKDPKTTSIFG